MKTAISILFLGILLFNWGGYHLLTDYLENKADNQLEASLDHHAYNDAELIRFKVAASLPYYSNSENFERVNGEININGIEYKYVKRRFYNDSIELLCIPNLAKTGLENARNDFYRLANDLVSNNNGKKSSTNHNHLNKFSFQDYNTTQLIEMNPSSRFISNTAAIAVYNQFKSIFLECLDHPPEAEA